MRTARVLAQASQLHALASLLCFMHGPNTAAIVDHGELRDARADALAAATRGFLLPRLTTARQLLLQASARVPRSPSSRACRCIAAARCSCPEPPHLGYKIAGLEKHLRLALS